MDKDFFKGLLLFVAGYATARWLIKNGKTSVPGTNGQGIAAGNGVNVDNVVKNVKAWLKTNFPELTDTEAENYAAESVGVTKKPNDQVIQDYAAPMDNTMASVMGQPQSFNDYNSDGIGGTVNRISPDKNDFFQAKGKGKMTLTGKMQDDYSWSFN